MLIWLAKKCPDTGAAKNYTSGEPERELMAGLRVRYNGQAQARNKSIASAVVALSRKNPHDVPPSASGAHSEFQFAQLYCDYDPDDHAFGQNCIPLITFLPCLRTPL